MREKKWQKYDSQLPRALLLLLLLPSELDKFLLFRVHRYKLLFIRTLTFD